MEQRFPYITKVRLNEDSPGLQLASTSTPRNKDTAHFFYMMSFPFKNKVPVSSNLVSDHPFSFKIGNNECLEAIEQCVMQLGIGERAQFSIFPDHKDFTKLLKNNNWTIEDIELTDTNNLGKIFVQ